MDDADRTERDEPESLDDESQQADVEHGRAVVAEARAVRRRMLDDAEQRRRAVIEELHQARVAIDDALAALGAPASEPAPTDDEPRRPPAEERLESPERVAAVFDTLRDAPPEQQPRKPKAPKPKAPRPKAAPADEQPEPTPAGEPEPAQQEPGSAGEPAATDADRPLPSAEPRERPGDVDRRRRDAVIEPLVPEVVRSSKRLLQDEQNSLLDAVRRARGRHEPDRLLPDAVRQREAWTALLGPAFSAAYLGGRAAAGKTGRVTSAPDRVVIELAATLVSPLRERIASTIDGVVAEGPYDSPSELQRALGSAIGARFREWRTVDLEIHVIDVLAAAYARGAYEASPPAAMLRWLPDEPGHCPDCDDNSLEPTLKGKPFPTGQLHPPAHPGCRCIAVPVEHENAPASS